MSDEYAALLEEARAALYDLIKMTEPGTGLPLHYAYGDIKRSLEREGKRAVADAPDPVKEERERESRERFERKERWRRMPWHERERLVLDVVGDDRLTKLEIVDRINKARNDLDLFESNVANLLARMLAAGELRREAEYRSNGKVWRYRYIRNTKLSGELADLNRQLEA